MGTKQRIAIVLAAAGLAAAPALAQSGFRVTGVIRDQDQLAQFRDAEGAGQPRAIGDTLGSGTFILDSPAQAMFFDPASATVVVASGPTRFAIPPARSYEPNLIALSQGRLRLSAKTGGSQAHAIAVRVTFADEPAGENVLLIGPGTTYVTNDGGHAEAAYTADAGAAPVEFKVGAATGVLPPNHVLGIDSGGKYTLTPLSPTWLTDRGLDDLATGTLSAGLAKASARDARDVLAGRLFDNVIVWERYAAAEHVKPAIDRRHAQLEIRQVTQATPTGVTPSSRTEAPQAQVVPAANEVPLLSPAAARVQDITDVVQGVSVTRLNEHASNLLTTSGSRGLGFEGLRLLTIPGFVGNGVRTVGPAGTGAR